MVNMGLRSNVDYFGVVRLKDDSSRFEYGLFDNRTSMIQYIDIEEVLGRIYKNNDNYEVCVTIELLKSGYNLEDTDIVFKSKGELFKKKVFGSYEWHIGNLSDETGDCLGDAMFDLVGKKIMFSLEVYN